MIVIFCLFLEIRTDYYIILKMPYTALDRLRFGYPLRTAYKWLKIPDMWFIFPHDNVVVVYALFGHWRKQEMNNIPHAFRTRMNHVCWRGTLFCIFGIFWNLNIVYLHINFYGVYPCAAVGRIELPVHRLTADCFTTKLHSLTTRALRLTSEYRRNIQPLLRQVWAMPASRHDFLPATHIHRW